MKNKATLIAAILFPILLMVGWTSSLQWDFSLGTQVELPIEGYDPRDILSGHFLEYRINFGALPLCEQMGKAEQGCVCLDRADDGARWKASKAGTCEQMDGKCNVRLKGLCRYGRFDAGLDRFYFPESLKDKLVRVPPGASVRMRVSRNGSAIVEDIVLDGKPLLESLTKP